MSKKVPCPKCGRLNELSFGTCDCSGCHQRYGLCKKCGKIFDASGGLSATCPDCRDEAAAVDSDGTFVGWLDAKIMNSNHNLEMHLLRLFVAIPLLKPMKLRRRGGFAWWFGTLWLTFYVGVILFIIASYGLKTGGAHPYLCSGIMGWGTAFILFLAPKLISVMIRGGSKKIKIMTISVLMLDITAVVLAYMFSIGSWTAPSMLIDSRDGNLKVESVNRNGEQNGSYKDVNCQVQYEECNKLAGGSAEDLEGCSEDYYSCQIKADPELYWKEHGCESLPSGIDCSDLDITKNVIASKTLSSQGKNSYSASHLLKNHEGIWAATFSEDDVIHESPISLKFNVEGRVTFGLAIRNGYTRDEKSYVNNSRMKTISVYADNKEIGFYDLQDLSYDEAKDNLEAIKFKPVRAKEISVYIADIYKGKKWSDVCVDEMFVVGY